MKRAFSIILLLVFLFNVGGYYVIFWFLRYQANVELTARLDANAYSSDETIELKIPVSLPYPLFQKEFERIDGAFEYQGEYYKLVKQKIENDTLHVVCIKNIQEKRIVNSILEYANLSNDLPGSDSKALNFLCKLLKEYNSSSYTIQFISYFGWYHEISFFPQSDCLLDSVLSIPSPPPKV